MARGEVIQVRVSVEEKERIAACAASAGVDVSSWVRGRALDSASVGEHQVREPASAAPGRASGRSDAFRKATGNG